MLFSQFISPVFPFGSNLREELEDKQYQIELADEIGFHAAWLAENHFSSSKHLESLKSEAGIISSPLLFAMSVIEHTRQIRIGTAFRNIIFTNPLLVAEEAILFNNLTKGKLKLGVGYNNYPWEFDGFNTPVSEAQERFMESLEILGNAIKGGSFEFKGKHYNIPELSLVSEDTKAGIPIYISAQDTNSIKLAAEKQHGVIFPATTTIDKLAQGIRLYKDCFNPVKQKQTYWDNLPVVRLVHISKDVKTFNRHIEKHLSCYSALLGSAETCNSAAVFKNEHIAGTPEECLHKLEILGKKTGCSHVILWFTPMESNIKEVVDQMSIFADEVLPNIGRETDPLF